MIPLPLNSFISRQTELCFPASWTRAFSGIWTEWEKKLQAGPTHVPTLCRNATRPRKRQDMGWEKEKELGRSSLSAKPERGNGL